MSTRSVIARKDGIGFKGVYHHWDGYPSGLGATLFDVRNRIFGGETKRMLEYLIDQHGAGWETINADWSFPAGRRTDHNHKRCKQCGEPVWKHYRQYYKPGFGAAPSEWECAGRPAIPPGDEIEVLGHSAEVGDDPTGPEPYGGKGDANDVMTDRNASGCGCEWAYVFDGNGKMEVQASVCGPGKFEGSKMVGAFGCGDETATWKTVAVVDLDGPEPDWEKMER